jgi:hypothetical protein
MPELKQPGSKFQSQTFASTIRDPIRTEGRLELAIRKLELLVKVNLLEPGAVDAPLPCA